MIDHKIQTTGITNRVQNRLDTVSNVKRSCNLFEGNSYPRDNIETKPQCKKGFHSLAHSRAPGLWSARAGQKSDRRLDVHVDLY